VDKLLKKIQSLKLEYKDRPQPELLVVMPNPYPGQEYEVQVTSPEFTALCPVNSGQPDFATVTIKYVPHKSIIEFKSLKLYLTSFRTVSIFYEESTNRMLEDLVKVIKPRTMEIVSEWNIRGGISTKITCVYNKIKRTRGG
jgi:7-cyano-7-deazaguanine reductase